MILAALKTKAALVIFSVLVATTAAGTVTVVAAKNNMGPLAPVLSSPTQTVEIPRAYPGTITAIDATNHTFTLQREGTGTLLQIQFDAHTKINVDGKNQATTPTMQVNEKVVVDVKDQSGAMYATDVRIEVNESASSQDDKNATPEPSDGQHHYTGKVTSVDAAHSTFTLSSNGNSYTFTWDAATKVEDMKQMTIAKLAIGETVEVEARSQNNQLMAMNVQIEQVESEGTPSGTETPIADNGEHNHPTGTPTIIIPMGTMPANGDSGH